MRNNKITNAAVLLFGKDTQKFFIQSELKAIRFRGYDETGEMIDFKTFGDDAITRDGVNEDPLPRSSTGDGWRMSIPFPSEDVEWASKELAARSSRITARAVGTNIEVEKDDDSQSGHATSRFGSIDTEEFFRS